MTRPALALLLMASTFAAASALAAPVGLADVRSARDVRQALARAKQLPEVRERLRSGPLVIATVEPTKQELARGQLRAAQSGRWELAGVHAELRLRKGLLGTRVEVGARPRYVAGITGMLGTDSRQVQLPAGLKAEHPAANLGGDYLELNHWAARTHEHEKVLKVPTWRGGDNLSRAQSTFGLTPALLADRLGEALAKPHPEP